MISVLNLKLLMKQWCRLKKTSYHPYADVLEPVLIEGLKSFHNLLSANDTWRTFSSTVFCFFSPKQSETWFPLHEVYYNSFTDDVRHKNTLISKFFFSPGKRCVIPVTQLPVVLKHIVGLETVNQFSRPDQLRLFRHSLTDEGSEPVNLGRVCNVWCFAPEKAHLLVTALVMTSFGQVTLKQ